jgi:hypothetical protein
VTWRKFLRLLGRLRRGGLHGGLSSTMEFCRRTDRYRVYR